MNQKAELTLTNGQRVTLEVIEGHPFNRFELSLTEGEQKHVLCSLLSQTQLTLEQSQQEEFKSKMTEDEKILKTQLSPEVYELYQAALNQPKLKKYHALLHGWTAEGVERQLGVGRIDQCLLEALKQMVHYRTIVLYLTIGENKYIFATFTRDKHKNTIEQVTHLPKRVIDLALPTVEEIDTYQKHLLETNEFTSAEILNAIEMLSVDTYLDRVFESEKPCTIFEEIALDVRDYESARAALEHHCNNIHADSNNERWQLIKKGLEQLAKEEQSLLKERLDSDIYHLYQTVLNQPKLKNIDCSLIGWKWSGGCEEILPYGSIEKCLMTALEKMDHYHTIDVHLPIGENVYCFATFKHNEGEDLIEQHTCLHRRVVGMALETTQEIDAYQHELLEAGDFDDEEILNSLGALSERTYEERIQNEGNYTLFEDIASEIHAHGSAKDALEYYVNEIANPSDKHCDLVIKGLTYFADKEDSQNLSEVQRFLKEQLNPEIYELYQAVLNQPKLKDVVYSVMVAEDSHEIEGPYHAIIEGTIEDCLKKALQEIKNHERLHVWLPIGENVYEFATFEQTKDQVVKQKTRLPKRVIKFALQTIKEIEDQERELLETGQFVDEEVLNAIHSLSNKTFVERLRQEGYCTPFEDISIDIFNYGSAKEALDELLFQPCNDIDPLRLKGLLYFRDREMKAKGIEEFLTEFGEKLQESLM